MNDREFEQSLKEFRGAVQQWSAASEPQFAFVAPVRTWAPRLRLAAAAALMAMLAAVPVYEKVQRDRQHAAQVEEEDAALLEQIDADLARSIPAPLEPLAQLVTFDSTTKEIK